MPSSKARRLGPTEAPADVNGSALILINLYLVRYLVRLYQAFEGDVLEAIVLGEIAHHNISAVLKQVGGVEGLRPAILEQRVDQASYLPTNAFSIAQATGIPRQTVRRKVAALVERGWLHEAEDGGLVVTTRPYEHFRSFNLENIDDFVQTARAVLDLLQQRAAERR